MRLHLQLLNLSGVIAALAWLSVSLATLFWMLMPEPQVAALEAATGSEELSWLVTPVSGIDYNSYHPVAIKLFRDRVSRSGKQGSGVSTGQAVSAATSLDLVLEGAIASKDESRARALISDGNERVSLAPGDFLPFNPSGVRLVSVGTGKVLLDNNGRYETLWMYEPPSLRQEITVAAISAVEPESENTASAAPITNASLDSLSDLFTVTVIRKQGAPTGLELKPRGDPALYHNAGLRNGDIIVAVNGERLDSLQSMETAARSLAGSAEVTLDVLRQGLVTPVHIDVTKLYK